MSTPPTLSSTIADLLITYNDLNSPTISILFSQPSPLEFMRYVSLNRPFVVRGGAASWKATKEWNAEYLTRVMREQSVDVAITPFGNADSVVVDESASGELKFVKPLVVKEGFEDFLEYLRRQELGDSFRQDVKYAQTQNDNLRDEYSPLFADVEKDIAWARIALARKPDAINLWIGNSRSVTCLHRDNYENIYVQIIGRKHFVLLPPVAAACVAERILRFATYVRDDKGKLVVRDDESGEEVPIATWDPDEPDVRGTEFSINCTPVRFTLEEGDMLYLPALWYHKVSQSCSKEGLCCAVNYWYDMEFAGSFYAMSSFIRNTALLVS